MRIIYLMLVAVVLQGLVLAGTSSPPSTSATAASSMSAAATPQLTCGKNERICTSCDGQHQFCGEFCLDCIPPAHEPAPTTPAEVAASEPAERAADHASVLATITTL